jgi:hypothetical protein
MTYYSRKNVLSVTDLGVGDYFVNFITDMNTNYYAVLTSRVGSQPASGDGNLRVSNFRGPTVSNFNLSRSGVNVMSMGVSAVVDGFFDDSVMSVAIVEE